MINPLFASTLYSEVGQNKALALRQDFTFFLEGLEEILPGKRRSTQLRRCVTMRRTEHSVSTKKIAPQGLSIIAWVTCGAFLCFYSFSSALIALRIFIWFSANIPFLLICLYSDLKTCALNFLSLLARFTIKVPSVGIGYLTALIYVEGTPLIENVSLSVTSSRHHQMLRTLV